MNIALLIRLFLALELWKKIGLVITALKLKREVSNMTLVEMLQSKTIWGGIIAFLGPIITKKTGIAIDADGWTEAIIGFVGAATVVWGRVDAARKAANDIKTAQLAATK